MDAFVDRFAHNIAALEDGVIAAAKAAVGRPDTDDGFERETASWMGLVFQPAAGKLMAGGLRAGAQTREGERTVETVLHRAAVR